MRYGAIKKRIISFVLISVMILSVIPSTLTYADIQDNNDDYFIAPTCESLTDSTQSQDRWLTIPDSRLIVNPYIGGSVSESTTQSDFSNDVSIPLNIGFASPYIERNKHILLSEVVGHMEQQPNVEPEVLFYPTANEWIAENNKCGFTRVMDIHTVYCSNTDQPAPAWQRFHAGTFSANITKDTYLSFDVLEANDGISCKIAFPEGGWVDYNCPLIRKEGKYVFNVADITGHLGNNRIRIDFYSVGVNAHIILKDVMVVRKAEFVPADFYTTSNNPAVNICRAHYPNRNGMTVKDCLADEISVLRTISYSDPSNSYLFGRIYGKVEVINKSLSFDMGDYTYSISCDNIDDYIFYDSYGSMISSQGGSKSPIGKAYYLVKVTGKNVNMVLSLDTKFSRSKEEVVRHSEEILAENAEDILAERTEYWDNLISKIPVPGKFNLGVVGADKTSQANIERMYYKSWTLIIASVLPVSPEIEYNFRTLANGKPSLWSEGGKHSQYVAMWDSVYGIRMLAYIDPEMAWDCFEGLMGDVEQDGSISGEGLPDQKAATLWHLYNICPDRQRMANLMDVMERHTEFSLNHTYWIYPTYNPDPAIKQSLYTETLANETLYLRDIYNELGNNDRANYWDAFASDYRQYIQQWHFGNGHQYDSCIPIGSYFNRFDHSDTLSNAGQALINVEGLRTTYKRILINDFKAKYDPSLVNGGFTGITAQGPLYMMYGYAKIGEKDIAKTVCEVTIRDVSQTIMPAERCDKTDDNTPRCGGVRPSFFTAALIIESVFLRNNIRMDNGLPTVYNLFDSGKVSNIHIGSKVIDISIANGMATVSGDIETTVDNLEKMGTYVFDDYGFGAVIAGDVDDNGSVTIVDALLTLRVSLNMSSVPEKLDFYVMDINGDGSITIADAMNILRKSLNY